MTLTVADDFDLEKIAESGQCFRWKRPDKTTYRIIKADQCVYVSSLGDDQYEFECDDETFQTVWSSYFDLETNYQSIRDRVPEEDSFLRTAMEQEKGIRILRQDSWEMLITSIITQNRNIPAIQRSIELMSGMCGNRQFDSRGLEYYAFPSARQLASLTDSQLAECKLGYRGKYIHAAAAAVTEDKIRLCDIQQKSCDEAIRDLTSLYGVGNKVASCVALFGLHQLDAFPRDVWINRALANEYPHGYPFKQYSPYNGVYQQYMFAYYRNQSHKESLCDCTIHN